jgi:galactokinase
VSGGGPVLVVLAVLVVMTATSPACCRLTGAGWGGCAVALVPEPTVARFLADIERAFYATRPHGDLSTILFASKPAGGAAVYTGV